MPDPSPHDLAECRKRSFSGNAGKLYRHIGYFVLGFGSAELYITHIMARALGFVHPDYERFHFLVKGMDARAKIERLFSAQPSDVPIGPNLEGRLEHFKEAMIPIRNSVSHSWPVLQDGTIHFATFGELPATTSADIMTKTVAPTITLDDLLGSLAGYKTSSATSTLLYGSQAANKFLK